ncbi:AGAMOUS-LIKE 58-RELATED [Salix viminalis]|uniref:AGAMOUS-LIKE 58-RELATED n=1 Tax=Salix viminalis TaxID=40686 RepID=A0A9Q0QJ97_SALVM|nr:AGAMOUS-LIKE 58-RELATED [Salix viminalis]
MEGKHTKGRQKIAIKRIENGDDRLITFSKRRSGIYKKASELVTLCGAEVAVLVFSPAGKPFSFGHPSLESLANRLLGQNMAPSDNTHPLVEAHRKEGTGEKSSQGWWEAPIDELSLQELKQMKAMLEEFHKNLYENKNELRRNGGASSSSFQAHSGHATNIPFCQL